MTHISIHDLLEEVLGPLMILAINLGESDDVGQEFDILSTQIHEMYNKYAEMESKLPGDGE